MVRGSEKAGKEWVVRGEGEVWDIRVMRREG